MPTSSEASDAGTPPAEQTPVSGDSANMLSLVLDTLENAKAEDVVSIALAGKSSIGDHMVVASGTSHRHVGAISDRLMRALKDGGHGSARAEGLPHCDWVLIDTGDVIVHVFRPEVREFYNLEKMWASARPEDTQVAQS